LQEVWISEDGVDEEKKLRVFLLTESRLLGEALSRILKKRGDIEVVGTLCVSDQSIAEITSAQPDILLADTSVTRSGCIQIVPELLRARPQLRVVLVGMEADKSLFLLAVKAGVGGYLLKDASSGEVAAAVQSVASGEAVCPPALCSFLFDYVAQGGNGSSKTESGVLQAKHPLGLSRREQQLVEMIGEGLTNKEIASRLNLSEQTVKNHVHRILRKVGASDRLSVVELCRNPDDLVA
jgi:DNA-binding NarL/FixJ family response regulator